MNFRENWWKFLVLALVVLGLIWWRQNRNQPEEELVTEAEQIEEQVNRYLEERGIELPEGGRRANLKDVAEGLGTGVATVVESDETEERTYTVIAGLPDLSVGWYVVWARNAEGDLVNLGRMRQAKGGYLLDTTSAQDLSGYEEVVISKEDSVSDEPSEIVLEGEFGGGEEGEEE